MPPILEERLSRRKFLIGFGAFTCAFLAACTGVTTAPQPSGTEPTSPSSLDLSEFDTDYIFEKYKGLSIEQLTEKLNQILSSGASTFPVENNSGHININIARNEAHLAWELIGRETSILLSMLNEQGSSLPIISKMAYESVAKNSSEFDEDSIQEEVPSYYEGEIRSKTASLMSAWLRLGFNRWWWGTNQGSDIELETSKNCFLAAYNIGVSYLRALALEDEKEINNLLNENIDSALLQIFQIKNVAAEVFNDMSDDSHQINEFDYIGSINTDEKDRRNNFLVYLFSNVDDQPIKDTLQQLVNELTNASGSSDLSKNMYLQELQGLINSVEINENGMIIVGKEPVDANGDTKQILLTKKEFLSSIFFNSPSMVPEFFGTQDSIGQHNSWLTAVVKSGVDSQILKMIDGNLVPIIQLVPGTVIPLPVDKNSKVSWERKEISGVEYIITQPDNLYIPLDKVQIAQTQGLLLHRYKKHFETLQFMMYYYFPDFTQFTPHKFNGKFTWASKINMGMYKARSVGDVAEIVLKYNPLHLFINTLPSSKIVGYDPGSVIYPNGVPYWMPGNPGTEVLKFSPKGYIVKSIESLWKTGKEVPEVLKFLLGTLKESWIK